MALDLDIEPRAEHLDEALEPTFSDVAKSVSHRPVDRPGGPAGERDEAIAVAQGGDWDMRFVAVGGIQP